MTDSAPLLWYNSGLSNTYDAVRLIREAAGGALRVLASHGEPQAPVLATADLALVEPAGTLSDADYVEWCLGVCRRYEVQLFMPSRRARALAAAGAAFAALGTRIQVFAPATLALFDHKDALYRDLVGTPIPLPEYRVVDSLAAFDDAYADLSTRHPRLCVKPTVGIYGAGFRILSETADDYDTLLGVAPSVISLHAYRYALERTQRRFELLLMPFLPGTERSVDCLAVSGRLVAAVARAKKGRHQVLETAGPTVDYSRLLTERYGLDGIFNCQFKDQNGLAHLLEINARMSGGLLYACQSGINFPYWSAVLALGLAEPSAVPPPADGIAIAPVQGVVSVATGQWPTEPAL
ncbi:ATP-grasp domain-containing protein [uncultured Thiodictyon sp.]|uniref:ATP-grasp domain-containing protein n=2 Tax=uncultured Thiodictyon sp. TaxID=1846217 RepID=UPI0025CF1A8B|nr:ATP-grasp domain-containing protein [uncultured Thiodictyon sp.]